MDGRPALDLHAGLTEPAATARILVLGTLRIECSGETLHVAGVHRRRLLAFLASRVGQAVSADTIVDALWGEAPPPTAAKTLQSHVARLRSSLGPLGAELIETTPAGYRLAHAEVDAALFEQLAGDGHHRLATRDVTGAVTTLEHALALWQGDPYADFPDAEFASHARTRLLGIHAIAVEDLAEARLESGAVMSAAAELERLVAADPGREHAWALLMRALYAGGRQQDSLVAFQRARRALADQLGLEPGPELRELERRVLAQDPALAVSQRAELPAALRVFTDELVGRAVEQAWLTEAWDSARRGTGQIRLVVGQADSGRTRLVAQLATIALGEHAAVMYHRAATDLAQTLVGANGASPSAVVAVVAERSRRQPVLFVVDDAEWASAATIETLRVLSAEVERMPALLICVVDESAGGPAAEAIRRLDPGGARTLVLGPIDDADIVRIAASEGVDDPGAQAAVASVSDGLPGVARREAAAWAERAAGDRLHVAAATSAGALAVSDEARDSMVDEVTRLVRARARRHRLASAAWVGRQPYVGLASYGPAEADVFVGRERLVAELAARLLDRRLVIVTGASGSGKSSLVRAGLVPLVMSGRLPGGGPWGVTVTTPGSDPLGALDRIDEVDRPGSQLIVIDQFEEALAAAPAVADAFVAQLVDLALDPALDARIVIVVRADQYQRVAELHALSELLDGGLLVVGRPTDDELRRIVLEPAERAGCRVEPALVSAVLTDVGSADGALPLVSAALAQLWEVRRDDLLTLDAYQEAGGLAASVERLGERVLGDDAPIREGVTDESVRRVLLLLADVTEDGTWVRRHVRPAEVPAGLGPALDALVDARLVVLDGDEYELAHEVVFRAWSRLAGWLEAARVDLTLGHDLRLAARAWEIGGRAGDDVWRGARLATAAEWEQRNRDAESTQIAEFIAAGLAVADRRRVDTEAQLARERRAGRRLRRSLVAACLLLAVAVLAAAAALVTRRQVADERDRANQLADQADVLAADANAAAVTAQRSADVASAREADAEAARNAEAAVRATAEADRDEAEIARLVAESERALSGRLDRALLLAVEARRRDDSAATRGALLTTLTRTQPGAPPGAVFEQPVPSAAAGFIDAGFDRVYSVSLSDDGATAAVSGLLPDGAQGFAVFDVTTGEELRRGVTGETGVALELSPTGAFALASTDRVTSLLAIREGDDLTLVEANDDVPIAGASLSPDGEIAAVIDGSGAVEFFDTRTGERELGPHPESGVGAGGFVENGTYVYGGVDARGVYTEVWDLAAGAVVHSVTLEPPFGVSFPTNFRVSPDGALLVGSMEHWGLFVWDLLTGALVDAPARPNGGRAIPVFVDDRTVALGAADGSIVLFDLAREQVVRTTLETAGGGIWALDATPDARLLASVADDGLVRIWQPDDRGLIDEPTAPGWWLGAVSADNSRYAMWSSEGAVMIRGTGPGAEPVTVAPPVASADAYQSLRMSADGSLLTQRIDWPDIPSIVRAIETATGRVVWELPAAVAPGNALGLIPTVSGDGIYVSDAADGSLTLYDVADGGARARLDQGFAEFMSPTPDGRYLDVSAGNSITRRDAATLDIVDTVDVGFFAQGPFAHLPGRDVIVVAGVGGRIASVDMSGGEVIATGQSADITSLSGAALSADGELVVSRHPFTSSIAIFDATTLRPLGQPLPAGDVNSEPPVVFTPDGGLLANARFGVNRWELDPDAWQEIACHVAGRNLTRAEWAEFVGDEPYRATCPNWPLDTAA